MATSRTGKRSTIGSDPFDAVIPRYAPPAEDTPVGDPDEAAEPPPAVDRKPVTVRERQQVTVEKPTVETAAPEPLEGRQKLTVHLDADVVNRVKNAAYWNPRLTIARIAERGIRLALKEVEKEHGGSYPQREGDLVGGRPIK